MTPISPIDAGAILGMAGAGIGFAGLGLKLAHPFVAMMRTPRPTVLNGNSGGAVTYALGGDIRDLIRSVDGLTTEVHNLVEANGEVLVAFRASLEKP